MQPQDGPRCGADTRKCASCGLHRREHKATGEAPACAFVAVPCPTRPVRGMTRCRMHGGTQAVGVASPAFRHGGYSKVIPTHLAQHYEQALADPQLLSLSHEIAMRKALQAETVQSLREGHTVGPSVLRAWQQFEAAHRSADTGKMAAALTALRTAMADASRYQAAREELRKSDLVMERLTRSENMRLAELHNMVTASSALALLNAFAHAVLGDLDAIVTSVEERTSLRRAAARRLAELADRRSDPAA